MSERAKGLSEQQYRFAEEYAIDLNTKRAAIAAGYSEGSAGEAGARLLRNPLVQEVVAKAHARFAQKSDVTKAWVVAEVKDTYLEAKGERDAETGKIVVPSDFTARLRSLELMARLHGFLVESPKTVRVIRGVEDLSDDELLALAAADARDGAIH